MTVKAKIVFETEDGRLFQSRKAANAHQRMRTLLEQLRLQLISPSSTLAIDVANDPKKCADLRDTLNALLQYHRDYGKLSQSKTGKQ